MLKFPRIGNWGLVMRTTFAAEPRSFKWHLGFHTQTYTAQPFPPIAWERVPVGDTLKWSDGMLLTWASRHGNDIKPLAHDFNAMGFLASI